MNAMLEVAGLDLHYGAAQALKGVSLTAEPGKVTCVLGRNGVGKTTLAQAIVGLQAISGRSAHQRFPVDSTTAVITRHAA